MVQRLWGSERLRKDLTFYSNILKKAAENVRFILKKANIRNVRNVRFLLGCKVNNIGLNGII